MTKMESEQESDHLLTESGTASPGPEVFVEMNNLDGNGHSVNFKPQNTVKYEKKATHKKKICLPKPDDEPQKNGQGASNRCNIEDNGSDSSYIQYEQETPVFRHRNSTSLVKATIDVPGDSLKKIRRRRRPPPGLGLKVVVFILFLMILVGVLVTWAFYKEERLATLRGQKFRFEEEERLLYLAFDDSDPIAIGTLGLNLPSWQLPKSCSDRWEEVNKLCYWWRKGASLELVYYKLDSLHCYNITWTSFSKDIEPKDCYGIGQLDWYGLSGNIRGAHHVLNKQNFSYVPLVPGGGRVLGSVLERYWLGSNGVAVITSRDDPVLLSWNSDIKDKFCLWSSFQHPFYSRLNEGKRSNLSYTMCKAGDMQSTHLAMRHFFKKAPSPKTQSLQDRIRLPLWAVGQVNLTNNTSPYETIGLELIDFVERNTTHPCGIVELDFGWEDNLGDLSFNEEELDDVMVMLQNLSSHGCQLSLPVSLFSHFMSENFNYMLRRDYFVRDAGGEATGLTKWNGDQLAYLDISNNEAVHWFFGKLRSLKSRFGISTFKFLHGESGLLPYKARFKEQFNPVVFTTTYNHLVANFTNVTVMHSAMGTQNLPIVISVIGKQVVIGNRQCLVDIIPAMLTVGILGYPYVSLDGSELWSHGAVASDLYLRWTQMSAFLPVMKIYTPPYGFTTENIQILKNWTELHIKTIVPLIESLSEEVVHGQPIIRPIWWVDPQDKVAQGIDDEFLVGNAILVAPILCEKTLKRDIYLPTGKWQDPLKHLDIDGGRWIYDYSIDLHDIPYFLARQ